MSQRSLTRIAVVATALLVVPACDSDGDATPQPDTTADASLDADAAPSDADATAPADADTGPGDVAPAEYLAIPAPAAGELTVIEPGGDTICSRGTPFRFFAVGGDPTRVIVDFQGGGACWNELTCSVADAIFSPEAPSEETIRAAVEQKQLNGLYRLDDPANPLAGWTLVHIPYCTGDVHWGDATHDYGDGLVIHHRGYVNAMAARAWIEAQYPDVQQVFVTGCSAGAYGAIGLAPYIAASYPNATISVLGDSGAGVITDTFFEQSFPNWNAETALPTWLDGLAGRDIIDLSMVDLYTAVANGYPNMRVAQYNTAFDDDQSFYYLVMGGDETAWSSTMFQQLTDIEAAAPSFRYYIAPGPVHCIHPYDFYFTRDVAGTAYVDWLRDLTSGTEAPASVACDDQSCLDDPVCNACDAGTSDSSACHWCDEWPP